ncbi:hypothetical protein B0T13DRAFT_464480 [Neurospora crassa]|nr:hypothetical protein B0T13DRAFT_464480 [Neurospora crassa]
MAWSPRRPAMLLPSWRLPSAQPYSTPYMIPRVSLVTRSSATSACVLSSRMSVFPLEWHLPVSRIRRTLNDSVSCWDLLTPNPSSRGPFSWR